MVFWQGDYSVLNSNFNKTGNYP